jgi:hypothetical protein
MKVNDKQKIVILLLALACNFTFLATANDRPFTTPDDRTEIPIIRFIEKRVNVKDSKPVYKDTIVNPYSGKPGKPN